MVLCWGLLRESVLPAWVGVSGGLIGLAAMGLTMALPDRLSLHAPVFHALAAWLAATGLAVMRQAFGPAAP